MCWKTNKMRLTKTKIINGLALALCFYVGFISNSLPEFSIGEKYLKVLVLVPKGRIWIFLFKVFTTTFGSKYKMKWAVLQATDAWTTFHWEWLIGTTTVWSELRSISRYGSALWLNQHTCSRLLNLEWSFQSRSNFTSKESSISGFGMRTLHGAIWLFIRKKLKWND